MNISRYKQKISQLRRERKTLEDRLLWARKSMVDCSVIKRYVACSRPNCRCQEGKEKWHGPFLYTSSKVGGKTIYRYVPKGQWYEVGEKAERYREYQKRLARVREINRKLDGLFNEIRDTLVVLGKKR